MTGVYIHIPFCTRKCLYCDFNSYADQYALENSYVDALIFEIEHYKGTHIDTLYIGGGTPSTLQESSLKKIIDACKNCFHLDENSEITVEVNPASSVESKLQLLRECGVNRLSIGVQSFSDQELAALGRLHTAEDAIKTVETAKKIGFSNISIDLMLAIPHQTDASLMKSLEIATSLSVEHISAYSLIIEPGTPFEKGVSHLPEEEEERNLYWRTVSFLEEHGFYQYEISNFSKAGRESGHNRKYWSGVDYIGIGAGAHSFVGGIRYSHPQSIQEYIKSPLKKEEVTFISPLERSKEYYLLGLRKREGVPNTGEFPDVIEKLKSGGLIEEVSGNVRLTKKGTDFANMVFIEFI